MADDDDIFRHITAPVENVLEYRPGGYHPLHLKDSLHDGRYLILRKLGYGSYSTTWLARDRRYVFNSTLAESKSVVNSGFKEFLDL